MRRITLNFEVAARPKKNGTYPIYLRVTENSQHYKHVLDVFVHNRKNFNAQAKKEAWINSKESYAKSFNSKLSSILELAHKIMLNLDRRNELSANNLMIQLKGGKNCDSFLDFIEKKIQGRLDKRQYSNAKTFIYLKQKLESYTKKKDILFKDLTYSFIVGFEHYLVKGGSKTKEYLSQTTVYSIFCRFKTLYREAVAEEYIINQNNPFDKIRIKKNKSIRIALTKGEIDKINDLNIEYDSQLWHVRNYFMFSMYMAGIRVGDVLDLKWENVENNYLVYVMQKTKSHCSLIIHEKAQKILDLYMREDRKLTDYIFPVMTMYENEKYKSRQLTEIKKRNRKIGRVAIINKHLSRPAIALQ
ncbi:MAG: site-specific integrase [Paludibacter sp.]|nr:site-specific integrase [Paludibacter sp.]